MFSFPIILVIYNQISKVITIRVKKHPVKGEIGIRVITKTQSKGVCTF